LIGRALVVAAVGLGLAAAGPSALAAHRPHGGSLPRLATAAPPGYGPDFVVRPHTIWFTGDNTGILGRLPKGAPAVGKQPGFLHWTTWTRERAHGVGTLWGKNCVPDCATSRFYRAAVTVTLTDPRAGHFGKMTLRYTYGGKLIVDTRCNYTGYTYWVLPPGLGRHDCPGPHVI
jgi:hypothetical protein